jgi:hypothetical protein
LASQPRRATSASSSPWEPQIAKRTNRWTDMISSHYALIWCTLCKGRIKISYVWCEKIWKYLYARNFSRNVHRRIRRSYSQVQCFAYLETILKLKLEMTVRSVEALKKLSKDPKFEYGLS